MRLSLDETIPDQTTITRTRRLIDVETTLVFVWVLTVLAEHGLLQAKRSRLMRRRWSERSVAKHCATGTGQSYEEFSEAIGEGSQGSRPDQRQLAKMDRKRKKGCQ